MQRLLGFIRAVAFGSRARFAIRVMVGARVATVMLAMTHDRMLANLAGAVRTGAGLLIHDRTPVVGWSPSVVVQRA